MRLLLVPFLWQIGHVNRHRRWEIVVTIWILHPALGHAESSPVFLRMCLDRIDQSLEWVTWFTWL